jgi:uncharacterized membrane protein
MRLARPLDACDANGAKVARHEDCSFPSKTLGNSRAARVRQAHAPPRQILVLLASASDRLFHTFTWLMVALGVWRSWIAGQSSNVPWSGRTFVGAVFPGWALFNLVEGPIDHQLHGLHPGHPGEGEVAWT